MAGSHRATPSPRKTSVSRRAVLVAVLVALVPAVGYAVHGALDNGSGKPGTHATPPPIPPVTTPVATPTASITPITPSAPVSTPAHPVTHVPPQPHLPHVALDVPRRLLSAGLLNVGFDDSVEPSSGAFHAASTAEVARWGSRGEPGMPAKDTVVVIGKSYTRGVSAFDTLPRIRTGARIVIRTDSGDLTYTVRSVTTQKAAGLARTPTLRAKAPGRLVVVGIGYDRSGHETGRATVVVAEVSAAVAR
ncbi:MAG: hypothetical protein ACJ72E_06995 [Marmoricola sp.]